jgi:ribonuclease E/ribonuclease G
MSAQGSEIEVWVDRQGPLTRVAVLADGTLTDLFVDHAARPSLVGAIYAARASRRVSGAGGAFLRLADGLEGWASRAPDDDRLFLATVSRDATGSKAAQVNAEAAFAGRWCLCLAGGRKVRVSEKIKGPAAPWRQLLSDLPHGWVVRTAASEAEPEELRAEAERLAAEADRLMADFAASNNPRQLRPAPDALERALAAYGEAVRRIRIDSSYGLLPPARRAALPAQMQVEDYKGTPALFELTDLEGAIATLLSTRVDLGQGASLVIEQTEALVAVDVNGGSLSPVEANQRAARRLLTELRLRNLGGIIIADFIDTAAAAREPLLTLLRQEAALDPAGLQVLGMTRLGLVEMVRTRSGEPLARLLAPYV